MGILQAAYSERDGLIPAVEAPAPDLTRQPPVHPLEPDGQGEPPPPAQSKEVKSTKRRRVPFWLIDALFLAALSLYVFLGTPLATYHGDESYYIWSSNDFDILFLQGKPQDLLVHSLWETDAGYHRLLGSTVSRYSIGLSWYLAGMTADELPDSGYLWGENYDDNMGRGLIPNNYRLTVYRMPSAIYFSLSIGVIFLLGKHLGGRRSAYIAAFLYTVNPVVLLNGRRAMQEAPLLFFGLLTMLIAAQMAARRERGEKIGIGRWIGLIVVAALTVSSKQSGFIYVAAAYGWISLPELIRLRLHNLGGFIALHAKFIVTIVLTLILIFVLNPALWTDPIARVKDILDGRQDAMRVQVDIDPNAPTTVEQRALDMVTQPFMTPVWHYELAPVRYSQAQQDEIDRYMASPLSGIQFGFFIGGALTLLALMGLIINGIPRLRPNPSWAAALGLYVWLGINVLVLITTPLPWQRYYLPYIPIVTLLVAIALDTLLSNRANRIQDAAVSGAQPA